MKIDRIARATLVSGAMALCACARDADEQGRAERDTTVAQPPAARLDTSGPAPAAPPSADAAGEFSSWVLRAEGIGPVRVGMTVAEADRAVGGLDRINGLEPCDYVRPRRGPAHVSLMVEDGRVVRVDVSDSASVATASGVRLGHPEAAVRQAHPDARVLPHKYDNRGHYVVVIPGAPADTLHRIVYETDGRVVTRMRGGVYPAVEYVEGCS
ncbi:MAG TPA: hypothetical protein VFJ16_30390 [Longimicrobium sp.]|nr:hypothetical protein [Longimicrobium sp.]